MRDGVAETACNWLCGFIGVEAVPGGDAAANRARV